MIIALTGAGGSIGTVAVPKILENKEHECRLLFRDTAENRKKIKKLKSRFGNRVRIVFGDISDPESLNKLIRGCDYIIHLAAVIPPKADHDEQLTWKTNYEGTVHLVDSIIENGNSAKLIFFSSVAVYGFRNEAHYWGRVGDPLLPSVFDAYGASKVKAERYILESGLNTWVILRESGVLYDSMMMKNIGDGLLFQTPVNAFIEWITVNDTALLLKQIVSSEPEKEGFWNNIYNIGGGRECRETGYETYNDGFALIGGSAKKIFEPNWHCQRNFHCFWFSDSDKTEEYYHFRTETCKDFWNRFSGNHKLFRLGRLLPPSLIKTLVMKPLLKDKNAPSYWISSGNEARTIAAFESIEKYKAIPESWDEVDLVCEREGYEEMKDHDPRYDLSHGYDESKPEAELDLEDMKEAASFRGGKVMSDTMTPGDMKTKLFWQCHNGHIFASSPYTILKAGHWCPECCSPKEEWNFDALSKHIPFFAQVWYDTHGRDENYIYKVDEKGNLSVEKDVSETED